MMTLEEFRNFRHADLTPRSSDIGNSMLRSHSIECAIVFYWNNLDDASSADKLIDEAAEAFSVPVATLKFLILGNE